MNSNLTTSPQYTFTYKIWNTDLSLVIDLNPNKKIQLWDTRLTFLIVDHYILTHLQAFGDGPLSPQDDPFNSTSIAAASRNCVLTITGDPPPRSQHLTYEIFKEVVEGLGWYLHDLDPTPAAYDSMDFEIWRNSVGILGTGTLSTLNDDTLH